MAFDIVHGPAAGGTVKEIVRYFANNMGGVHRDPEVDDLPDFLATLPADLVPVLTLTVAAIGHIVVRALEPLAAQLYVKRPRHR